MNSFTSRIRFKPRNVASLSKDHEYTIPPKMTQPYSLTKYKGDDVELKECDELASQEDKDKEYYFMDATLIGSYI